jgi:hypothetical protein
MLHVGNNVTDARNRTIERTKKVHGVIKHTEKQFQKYSVPGKMFPLMNQQLVSRARFQDIQPKKNLQMGP